ncbi:MAG TPA: hypothetical protein PLT98_03200, partial [Thauera aminoaromatica]|nr:hypothetical protein [Thauera aminoaromatica]
MRIGDLRAFRRYHRGIGRRRDTVRSFMLQAWHRAGTAPRIQESDDALVPFVRVAYTPPARRERA